MKTTDVKTLETSTSVSTTRTAATAATAPAVAAAMSLARLAMTPVDVVGLSRRVRRLGAGAGFADQGWTLPVAATPVARVALVSLAPSASTVPSTGVVYPEPGGPPA